MGIPRGFEARTAGSSGGAGPPAAVAGEGGQAGYDEEGVDRTLIREWLAKCPSERLELADACAREIEMLRSRMRARPART